MILWVICDQYKITVIFREFGKRKMVLEENVGRILLHVLEENGPKPFSRAMFCTLYTIYVSWLGVYLLEAYRIFADVFRINKAL